ncbi:Pentatricopeptide repeat-containing protein At3g13160, mitochondrial [Linum grandiflorum]
MATLSRILRRSFSTATAAAATTTSEPRVRALSRNLHKEPSLKRLVEKFKQSSRDHRFRTKIGVYEDVVRRLASAKCFNWVQEILEDQKQYSDMSKEGFNARLITLYGRAGMFPKARQVFDEMPGRDCERTALSFNALLSACLNSKRAEKVEELFKGLSKEMGIEPDVVSYNTLIKAYCEMESLDSALELIKEMEVKGLEPTLVTYNTLLHGLYANGRLDDGDKIWGQMLERGLSPDIRSYNAKLLGLKASDNRMEEAEELVNEMGRNGIETDVHSFIAMIKGCVKLDNLEGAKRWYEEIQKQEIAMNSAVFYTLVPFLCEKGDLQYAFEVCRGFLSGKVAVDGNVVQSVVDGLIKGQRDGEAEELVELGCANKYKLFVRREI